MAPVSCLVITGGIGSGKSTVSGFLSQRGWAVLDADRVGHQVLEDPAVLAQIQHRWPQVIREGRVDRARLGEIVFSSPTELQALERITHPPIVSRIDEWCRSTPGRRAVELSVMRIAKPEWGPVVVVDAPEQVRLPRATARGLPPEAVRRRMAAQPPRAELLARASFVIDNSRSLDDLREATGRLASHLEAT
jgi:dephospho-CoA kinase